MADLVSRRSLMAAALGAVAGIAARALPVSAGSDPLLAGSTNDVTSETGIVRQTPGRVLTVLGDTPTEEIVRINNASGSGLWVGSRQDAIRAESRSVGVHGINSTGSGKSGAGVKGTSVTPGATGVVGEHPGDGIGVRGLSGLGRGGVFEGGAAQVRLLPSALPTHPPAGVKGDLFLDRSGRLWLCRGGTSWVQLG